MMRKSVLLAVVSVLALVASMVLVAPAAQASTAMPVWTAGDYWVYSTTSISQYLGSGYTGSATLRYDVIGPESIAIGGTSVSTIKVKVNLTISASAGSIAVTFWENGFQWYRASDLANTQQSLSVKIGPSWFNTTLTYNPPPDIHWPLTPGASWNTNTNVTTVYNANPPSTYAEVVNQTVLSESSMQVTAGNFTVTPLKVLEGFSSTYTNYYWSGTVGNYVSVRDFYASNNTQRDSMDLKSYSYGGALNSLFLGLSLLLWIVILVIVVVVVIAAVVLLRRKRVAPPPMQPGMPPYMPPQQPPAYPPQQPPQGPMGPPPSP